MGTSKFDRDRRVLRSKKRGQKNTDEVRYCEIAPVECNCLGNNCKQKGGH